MTTSIPAGGQDTLWGGMGLDGRGGSGGICWKRTEDKDVLFGGFSNLLKQAAMLGRYRLLGYQLRCVHRHEDRRNQVGRQGRHAGRDGGLSAVSIKATISSATTTTTLSAATTEADTLYGEGGRDDLYGGDHNDVLYGGSLQDKLFGGLGHDTLSGDENIDRLSGEQGNDTFVFKKGDALLRRHQDRRLDPRFGWGADKIDLQAYGGPGEGDGLQWWRALPASPVNW